MKQRPISKDIQPAADNNPQAGRLALKVRVTTKSLLMTPWFLSLFLLPPVAFGVIFFLYPETRFISAILGAVAVMAVFIRIKFRRYKPEDELVVYKNNDEIIMYKKSEISKKITFDMTPVTRAWMRHDYAKRALTFSAIILFVPANGETSPKRGFFNSIDSKTEKILPIPRMHPNIFVVDDINLMVITFIEQNFPWIAVEYEED